MKFISVLRVITQILLYVILTFKPQIDEGRGTAFLNKIKLYAITLFYIYSDVSKLILSKLEFILSYKAFVNI